jgi:hypothetical protein
MSGIKAPDSGYILSSEGKKARVSWKTFKNKDKESFVSYFQIKKNTEVSTELRQWADTTAEIAPLGPPSWGSEPKQGFSVWSLRSGLKEIRYAHGSFSALEYSHITEFDDQADHDNLLIHGYVIGGEETWIVQHSGTGVFTGSMVLGLATELKIRLDSHLK